MKLLKVYVCHYSHGKYRLWKEIERRYIKKTKTKAHDGVIHSFRILFDVSKFNSVFKLISQVSCQDLATNKEKQPQPDYKGKKSEIRE